MQGIVVEERIMERRMGWIVAVAVVVVVQNAFELVHEEYEV